MIEQPSDFNELFAQYHEADGLIDGEFLDRLPVAQQVWEQASTPESARAILALPLAFREAILFGLQRDVRDEILAECLRVVEEKSIKKRLKRILFELERAGHAVSKKPKRKALFQREASSTDAPTPCFVSHADGRNERILIINEPAKSGVRTLQVYERDGDSVVHHFYDETSRKKMKAFLSELTEVHNVPLLEIEPRIAHFLLRKLCRHVETAGNHFPTGFTTALGRLNPPADLPDEHPYRTLVAGERVLARFGNLAASDSLHNEPEFRFWICNRDTLTSFQMSLQDMQTTGLAIGEEQKREQVEARIQRTINGFFAAEKRAAYADRLRDEAFFLALRGAAADAETAAALALYLDDADRPAGEVPFFKVMLTKAFGPMPQDGEKAPESPGGLIL